MKKLTGRRQTFCASSALSLRLPLSPEAKYKPLRGRNLSAVFRTLYRQVGQPQKRLPSCAQTWRVENQCDKSNLRTSSELRLIQKPGCEKSFHLTLKKLLTKQSNGLSIFSGQVHNFHPPQIQSSPTQSKAVAHQKSINFSERERTRTNDKCEQIPSQPPLCP